MVGRRLFLAIAVALVTSSALWAQPSIVNIQLRPGNPRTIEVTPNASAVCRNTPNCPTELNFRWVGPKGSDPTARIHVDYKPGLFWGEDGTPSQVAAQACFDFPGGDNSFALEHGAANGRNLVFKSEAEECPHKVTFFFERHFFPRLGIGDEGLQELVVQKGFQLSHFP